MPNSRRYPRSAENDVAPARSSSAGVSVTCHRFRRAATSAFTSSRGLSTSPTSFMGNRARFFGARVGGVRIACQCSHERGMMHPTNDANSNT